MRLLLALLLAIPALAQTGTSYTFLNPPPPQVTSLSGVVVGEPGQETYYYWVVARYPGGNSAPYGPITVRNARTIAQMGTLRYITISWTGNSLATGYDVLRSTSSTTPSGACGCVIYSNTASTSVNDTGITASAYTVTNGASVYASIYIDSLNEATPKLKQDVNGTVSDIGSGTGGVTAATDLTDLKVTASSSTALAIAAGNVRFGNTTYTVAAATATITAGSGSGTAKVFLTAAGAVVVEHPTAAGLTITCSSCTASQVTTPTVPSTAIPLADVTISSGNWGTVTDSRAMISSKPLTASTGITITDTLGEAAIAIDTAEVVRTSSTNTLTGTYDIGSGTLEVPNSTSLPGTCSVGQVFMDTDATSGQRIYACESANTWVLQGGSSGTAAAGTWDICVFSTCAGSNGDTWTANRVYYQAFTVPINVTGFRYVSVRVGSAGSGNIAVALYDSSCNRIANTTGTVSATSNSDTTITTTAAVNLTPGQYYFGFAVENAASLIYGDGNARTALLNKGSVVTHFYGSNASTGTGGSLTLPSACGTKTAFTGGDTAGVAFPSFRMFN